MNKMLTLLFIVGSFLLTNIAYGCYGDVEKRLATANGERSFQVKMRCTQEELIVTLPPGVESIDKLQKGQRVDIRPAPTSGATKATKIVPTTATLLDNATKNVIHLDYPKVCVGKEK